MVEPDGGGMNTARYRPSLPRTVLVGLHLVAGTVVLSVLTIAGAAFGTSLPLCCARLWCRLWLACAGVHVRCRGLDRLERSRRYVFVSNHQSALDIPLLYAVLPFRLSFIAKKELFLLPFFGWGTAALGHVYVDRRNPRRAHASIAAALERLRRGGCSLVVFPEGTRSSDGVVGPFKTGSFQLAIEAGVELVPVAIRNSRMVLPKHSWLHGPGPVDMTIGIPVSVEGMSRNDKADLANRMRRMIVEMAAEPPKDSRAFPAGESELRCGDSRSPQDTLRGDGTLPTGCVQS